MAKAKTSESGAKAKGQKPTVAALARFLRLALPKHLRPWIRAVLHGAGFAVHYRKTSTDEDQPGLGPTLIRHWRGALAERGLRVRWTGLQRHAICIEQGPGPKATRMPTIRAGLTRWDLYE